MTPQDERLLSAVADLNGFLDKAALRVVSPERREQLAAAVMRRDPIVEVHSDAERQYVGHLASADSNPAALRFNAVRSMGRE